MPRKISPIDRAAQERNARLKEKLREQEAFKKYVAKQRAEQKKARDAILRDTLRKAKGKGLYDPKSLKLTDYRRKQARKIQREYGEFLNSDKYFFVAPAKTETAKFVDRAKALTMKTTKTGVFIAKEGHKTAKVKYDKKRDELYIERRGKRKVGPSGSASTHRTITPLASADELDKERDRLRALGNKLGPLKGDDRLIFTVHENGIEGYSKNTFGHIDLLLQYLDRYQKNTPAKVQFFRHITVEKRGRDEYHAWQREYRKDLEARKLERLRQYGKERRSRIKKLSDKGK